ncbi:hypothetical protein V5799_007353 [Amblyomma americanum]|uniref:Uncharacterized protein n=1 Tax=Amblyomma americanum TaxID=6943 RepID=A0AAQ4DTS7_AMBAM
MLRKVGVQMINATEMSAQEAAWILLNFGMSQTSTDVIFVNTVWPEERVRSRKTARQMDAEQLELNSTDIWHKTSVEKYGERSPDMEHLTFADFMTDYSLSRGTKRGKTAILRCRDYDINDVVNCKRKHVMLYLPFRKENYFLDGNGFDQIFNDNKERIMEAKAKYNSGVTKAELLQYIRDINTRQDIVPLTDATTDAIQEDDDQRRTGCATLVEENDNRDTVPESTVTSIVVAA